MNDYNDRDEYNYGPTDSPGPGPGTPRSPGPGNPRSSGQNGDFGEIGSWIFGVVMLFVFPPLGLFLTISHAIGSDFLGKLFRGSPGSGRTRYDASSGRRSSNSRPGVRDAAKEESARRESPSGAQAPKAAPQRRSIRRVDAGAKAMQVFGWILVVFGALGLAGEAASALSVWTLVTLFALVLGGGTLILRSRLNRRREEKFRRCMTISGDRGIVDIRRLSATLGLNAADTDKLLTDMVDRGYYGERAYIDHERSLLVIDPEEMRDVYRREDEEKSTREEREQKERQSEYDRIIEEIRQADVDIEDEAMSEKIRRMQSITTSIFREVEEHPEKKSQIQRFMNYYLPTTLKLLRSYARIEEQGVSGQNMAKAKADIEGIADTLVEGYEKQLDTLFGEEAIDIAGDVSVIENMMKRDGLAGKSDFSPFSKNDQNGQVSGGH